MTNSIQNKKRSREEDELDHSKDSIKDISGKNNENSKNEVKSGNENENENESKSEDKIENGADNSFSSESSSKRLKKDESSPSRNLSTGNESTNPKTTDDNNLEKDKTLNSKTSVQPFGHGTAYGGNAFKLSTNKTNGIFAEPTKTDENSEQNDNTTISTPIKAFGSGTTFGSKKSWLNSNKNSTIWNEDNEKKSDTSTIFNNKTPDIKNDVNSEDQIKKGEKDMGTSNSIDSSCNHVENEKNKEQTNDKSNGNIDNKINDNNGQDVEKIDENEKNKPDLYVQVDVPLEQKKIVTGEEEETSIFSSRAKLYFMELNNTQAGWKERGTGTLHVNTVNSKSKLADNESKSSNKEETNVNNTHKNSIKSNKDDNKDSKDQNAENKAKSEDDNKEEKEDQKDLECDDTKKNLTYKSRIVMRADGVLKVILNLPIVSGVEVMKGMKSSLSGEKFIRISAIENQKPVQFAIKFGTPEKANELFKLLKLEVSK